MESPKARQLAEYEVLKAVFDRDVETDESSEWLDISIALGPSHDSHSPDVYATIVLRVQCSEHYPDREPTIILSGSKGLSKVQIEALQEQLEQLARELRGEVMILQLAQSVQEYLHEHNKPGTKSFYDEMLERNLFLEQQRNRSEEYKKIIERKDIQDRVILKEVMAPPSSDEEISLSDEEIMYESVRRVKFALEKRRGVRGSSYDVECDHRSCKYIQFGTKVLRGRCMEHDEHSVVYHGIDVSNGDPNLIREYILKPQEKQNSISKEVISDVLKQLDSIHKELLYLKRFRHENLVLYLDFKHIVEKDYIVTYLVQEFVSNVSLASYGRWDVAADFVFIRYIVTGVLRALAYLHQHNVIHKNIKSSSIYLSKGGEVKLGDYSLMKRMEDLKLSCRQIEPGGGRSKVGRAADVLQLATLVLGLLGMPADPVNPPSLPELVPPDLRDFLQKCFLEEERRWTARQLLEHEFVNSAIRREPWTRDRRVSGSGAGLDPGEDTEEDADQLISQFKIPNDLKYQSRLSSEFRVLKYLGSGSFGKVLKARNNLDRCTYAIKAIELNPRNKQLNRKMIREVKLLSKLNHENVVRYFNSWIETTNVDDSSSAAELCCVSGITSSSSSSVSSSSTFATR